MPSALAVLPNGDFAVLDPAKRRVLRVRSDGSFAGEWTGVAQQASDMEWDARNDRLVLVDNEAGGVLGEVGLRERRIRKVDSAHSVYWLAATGGGVFALDAVNSSSPPEDDRFTAVPAPLKSYAPALRGPILLSDGSGITFRSNRDGDRWWVRRSAAWELSLRLVGTHGPRTPVASLTRDVSLHRGTLVTAALVGSYASDPGLRRRLVVAQIDLDRGRLASATDVAQCGLRQDENLTSRITVDQRTGDLYQLCLSPTALEIRKGPRLRG